MLQHYGFICTPWITLGPEGLPESSPGRKPGVPPDASTPRRGGGTFGRNLSRILCKLSLASVSVQCDTPPYSPEFSPLTAFYPSLFRSPCLSSFRLKEKLPFVILSTNISSFPNRSLYVSSFRFSLFTSTTVSIRGLSQHQGSKYAF